MLILGVAAAAAAKVAIPDIAEGDCPAVVVTVETGGCSAVGITGAGTEVTIGGRILMTLPVATRGLKGGVGLTTGVVMGRGVPG